MVEDKWRCDMCNASFRTGFQLRAHGIKHKGDESG